MPPKVVKQRNHGIMKGEKHKRNHRGRQGGSCSQEQRKKKIEKGNKFWRQGGSCSQEQRKRDIKKGDKFGRQSASCSQERPKRGIKKENNLETQGGGSSQEQPKTEIEKKKKKKKTYSIAFSYLSKTIFRKTQNESESTCCLSVHISALP